MSADHLDLHAPLTLPDVLSRVECSAAIARAEAAGFEAATIVTSGGTARDERVRNNSRLIADDVALASDLWGRVAIHVPRFIGGRQAIGLNERFRIYRYEPGQKFSRHQDAPFRRANGEQSLLTFMIYLNDDFGGGETAIDEFVVAPRTGMALLFRHEVVHEGRAVTRGVKYVLRSDVMFNPVGRISG